MQASNVVTRMLDIRHPVIQAPMAGGVTTPELVAAVSNAGGLGSLGAGYLSPDALRAAIGEIRVLTDQPFAVNLFIPSPFEVDHRKIEHANSLMRPFRETLGIACPESVTAFAPSFDKQLEVVLAERVPVFSFTFGRLGPSRIEQLRRNGTIVVGTATTVEEAVRLEADGVELVVAQGAEAGGHRGTFLGPFEEAMIGTMTLVPHMAERLSIPVIASGGIMTGQGLAQALARGAQAAQMGSAFLLCEESGAHPAHKQALLAMREDRTVITRAFSGKPARGLENRFIREMAMHEASLPVYPVQNACTGDLRKAAQLQYRPEFMSLWAGQSAHLGRRMAAADLVRETVDTTGV